MFYQNVCKTRRQKKNNTNKQKQMDKKFKKKKKNIVCVIQSKNEKKLCISVCRNIYNENAVDHYCYLQEN